jgi:predicted Zn-dependent protease
MALGAAAAHAQVLAPTTAPAPATAGYAQQLQSARALEAHANQTHDAADYRAAAEALEACSQQRPDDVLLHRSLGYLFLENLNQPDRAFPHLEAVYKATPDAPGWDQMLIRAAGETGHLNRQAEVLEDVAKRNPKDPWCRIQLGAALNKTGHFDQAEETYKDAVKIAPHEEWVGIAYARFLKSRGKLTDAQTLATNVLTDHPGSAPATALLQDIGRANWKPATVPATAPAIDAYAEQLKSARALEAQAYKTHSPADYSAAADALEACSLLHPEDVQLHRSLGALYLDELDKPELAYPHLEAVYKATPDAAGWGQMLARDAGKTGRIDRQIQVLTEVAEHNPKDPWCRIDLAEALNMAGRVADADQAFRSAIKVAPDEEWVNIPYARFLNSQGKSAEATRVAESVLDAHPKSAAATALLRDIRRATEVVVTPPPTQPAKDPYAKQLQDARALEMEAYKTQSPQDYRAAADALEACSKIHPEDTQLHKSLGFIYLDKLNQPALAYPHLLAFHNASPDLAAWGQMLARDLGAMGKTDEQIQLLREVAAHNPKDPWSRLDLAEALSKAGRSKEAEAAYKDAAAVAPDEEWANIPYARFLNAHGKSADAERIARGVLRTHPKSAAALALLGDIHKANWNLSEARAEYAQAMIADPSYYAAKSELSKLERSQAPLFKSTFFLFSGTDHFFQSGSFNTLHAGLSDHLAANVNFNAGWFENDKTHFSTITRLQEGAGLEAHLNSTLSLQAGATGFEVINHDRDVPGMSAGATWTPNQQFWVYASYRLQNPIDDSIYTVANGLTQNVVGISSGYQVTENLSANITASRASYSDHNERNFIHAESKYMLWKPWQLRAGAEFEVIDYEKARPQYSSPSWYQTYGPLIELEPPITKWLSIHGHFEAPFVEEARQFGAVVAVGPRVHLDERFEFVAEYLYYNVPGSFVNYSGQGFRAALSYRF